METSSKRSDRKHQTPPRLQAQGPSGELDATLLGGGETLDVVGESYHQEPLWSIVGGHISLYVQQNIVAVLIPESSNTYDSNAISVWIDGFTVGHLSRDDAARYRPGLLALWRKHEMPIALRGRVIGVASVETALGFLAYSLTTTQLISAWTQDRREPCRTEFMC
jgi:hypothetical protein